MLGRRVTTLRLGHVGVVVDRAATLAELAARHLTGIAWDAWLMLQEPPLADGEALSPWLALDVDGDIVMVPLWDAGDAE